MNIPLVMKLATAFVAFSISAHAAEVFSVATNTTTYPVTTAASFNAVAGDDPSTTGPVQVGGVDYIITADDITAGTVTIGSGVSAVVYLVSDTALVGDTLEAVETGTFPYNIYGTTDTGNGTGVAVNTNFNGDSSAINPGDQITQGSNSTTYYGPKFYVGIIKMSRVGKQPVILPSGVQATIHEDIIVIKGEKGELKKKIPNLVNITKNDEEITVKPKDETKDAKAAWGLVRTNIFNMVNGVKSGFSKILEINGVGYRAAVSDNILTLQLGYSHDIKLAIPSDIEVKCLKPTEVEIQGIDKQKVGQFASEVRKLRKPEPYKGKGVKYQDEIIRRKEGKKK